MSSVPATSEKVSDGQDWKQKYIIPQNISKRFERCLGLCEFYHEICVAGLIVCLLLQIAKGPFWQVFVLVRHIFIAAILISPYAHVWKWITKFKCKKALRNALPDQESCAIFYGPPTKVLESKGLFWDIGLIRAEGGIQFEGDRHSFSLTATQIERTESRPQLLFGCSELLEVVWRTPSGRLSSIFIWDPGSNKNPSDAKEWLSRVVMGSRPCGPLPIDCSQFPTAPRVQGWGFLALGTLLGLIAMILCFYTDPSTDKAEIGRIFVMLIAIALGVAAGWRWQRMLTNHRAAKLAIVESTE